MKRLTEYMYSIIEVKTKDGRVLSGQVVDSESSVMTDSGFDEISLEYHTHQEVIDESEIESIRVIKEYKE